MRGYYSSLGKNSRNKDRKGGPGNRSKRNKTESPEIHETVVLEAQKVPNGSKFRGYVDFTVQDRLLQPLNTLYT
jgi:hypothetical protein